MQWVILVQIKGGFQPWFMGKDYCAYDPMPTPTTNPTTHDWPRLLTWPTDVEAKAWWQVANELKKIPHEVERYHIRQWEGPLWFTKLIDLNKVA